MVCESIGPKVPLSSYKVNTFSKQFSTLSNRGIATFFKYLIFPSGKSLAIDFTLQAIIRSSVNGPIPNYLLQIFKIF